MANHWILKTEPGTHSFDDLVRDGRTRWDGVANPVALKHIRNMRTGDTVMIYHTGSAREAVGIAKVASDPYADPKGENPKLVVVDLEAGTALAQPVPLAVIKADPLFSQHPLVRMGRLSVAPLSPPEWKRIRDLGGMN
ncbi:MAG: EVE domain-containing protein [Gemmatimonadales bacterium]|nr:MAG: EVE domain-containing protein [Gemmatimonadales bacterium]